MCIGLLLSGIVYFSGRSNSPEQTKLTIMKDVGEAYMDKFGLTENDFKLLRDAHITVIEGNFDICASVSDVTFFLNQSRKYGLKVILPAGSGEAEWGYGCDQDSYPKDQKPVWMKEAVIAWIDKWKNHPAVYAWDISNEAGSVFPNASWYNEENGTVPDADYITEKQLKMAYTDVKMADPTRPIMIRMNGWFFYDYEKDFFRAGNPFGKNVADIVMVNAYSNVDDHSPQFVTTVSTRAKQALWKVDPEVKIVIALGAWKEEPLWLLPSKDQFLNDTKQVTTQSDIIGIAYFKYGAKNSEWYLPDKQYGAPHLFEVIAQTHL